MKTKRNITLIILLVVIVSTANAYQTSFEDKAYGSYSSIEYSWVSFTNNMGNLDVTNSIPGPPFTGTHSILGPVSRNSQERYIATFKVSGIREVSVVMGDFNADEDPLFLEAYNSSNTLIDSDFSILPGHVYGGHLLSVSALEDISYVHFYSGKPYPGSVFFDNFSACVPEPATMALLGLGGLLIRRKRNR